MTSAQDPSRREGSHGDLCEPPSVATREPSLLTETALCRRSSTSCNRLGTFVLKSHKLRWCLRSCELADFSLCKTAMRSPSARPRQHWAHADLRCRSFGNSSTVSASLPERVSHALSTSSSLMEMIRELSRANATTLGAGRQVDLCTRLPWA